MKYIVYILFFFPVWVTAQTYKYIGIEDGLSNRRIFNIQKDAQGYMWFLTNEGMDRYNGRRSHTSGMAVYRTAYRHLGDWQARENLSI